MAITVDKKNDIVLTPDYLADFMADLIDTNEGSVVLDNAAGAGSLLKAAARKGAHAIGIEYNGDMYQLLQEELHEYGDKADLICGDGLELPDELMETVNTVIINPPFSFPGKGFIFALEAFRKMKSGKAIVLVPETAGEVTEISGEILKYSTLQAVIKLPDVFKGFASVQTSLFLFNVGRPHEIDDEVTFVDFSEDGYRRSGRKTQKGQVFDMGDAADRYKEVFNIVKNNAEPEIYKEKIVRNKIPLEGGKWTYGAHVVIDIVPTEEDFKRTVAEYLQFKVNQALMKGVK